MQIQVKIYSSHLIIKNSLRYPATSYLENYIANNQLVEKHTN